MNIHSPAAPVAEDKHPTRPELAKNYPEANAELKDCKVGPESSATDAYNIRSTGAEEAEMKKKGSPGSLPNVQFTQ